MQQWNGTTTTYTLTPTTTYSEGSFAATAAALVVGDRVSLTLSSTTPTTVTAVKIQLAELVGKVTAVSGTSITVSDPQGFARTIIVSGATTYVDNGAAGNLGDVVVGAKIVAQGTIDANKTSLDALSITIGSGEHNELVRGTVTATTATSVTVEDHKGVSTTFTYTPTTKFLEGKTSVTASSLAVGERVSVEVNSAATTTALSISITLSSLSGKVSAVTSSTITITDPQGFARTIDVSASTTYTSGATASTLSAVVVGSRIVASGLIAADGSTLDAISVAIVKVPVAAPVGPTPEFVKGGGNHSFGGGFYGGFERQGHHR